MASEQVKNLQIHRLIKFFCCLGLLIVIFWPVHMIWQGVGAVQALRYRDQDLYIFVEQETDGWRGFLAEALSKALIGIYDGKNRVLRKDLIVFHLQSGRVKKYYFKNLDGGSVFPVHGILHCGRSLRWTGTGFERLNETEADQLDRSTLLNKQLQEKQGWYDLGVNGELVVGSQIVKMRNQEYTLVFEEKPVSSGNHTRRIIKLKGLEPSEQQILYQIDNTERFVSRKTYMEYAAPD